MQSGTCRTLNIPVVKTFRAAILAPALLLSLSVGASSPFGSFASQQHLTYEGTWLNTTFGSTDALTAELHLDGYDFSGKVTLQGFVFGIGIEVPLEFAGTMEEDLNTTFEVTMPIYGDVELNFDFSESPAVLTARAVPNPEEVSGIASGTEEATFDFIDFDATFSVNFTSGSPAAGETTASLVEMAPEITSLPSIPVLSAGNAVDLNLEAIGSLIEVAWFVGESGDTSNPVSTDIEGHDDLVLQLEDLQETTAYWARVTNHAGTHVDSETITVRVSSLFKPTANEPEGFHQSPWFGWLYVADAPWYYHYQHHYIYAASLDESSVWIFDRELGWYWTNAVTWPNLARADGSWLRYTEGSTNPRWFYDYAAETYISLPPQP